MSDDICVICHDNLTAKPTVTYTPTVEIVNMYS